MKHYPYSAEIGWRSGDRDIWWPVSSNSDDNMVIGDGIPGDQVSALLCARCCNIAYGHALEDVRDELKKVGIDITPFIKKIAPEAYIS